MKIDIKITTDKGIEYIGKDLGWSEACAAIVDQYLTEQLTRNANEFISAKSVWSALDEAVDQIIDKEFQNKLNNLKGDTNEI